MIKLEDLLKIVVKEKGSDLIIKAGGFDERITRLADEICADCVPRRYASNLGEWMNRIQSVARELR